MIDCLVEAAHMGREFIVTLRKHKRDQYPPASYVRLTPQTRS